MPAASPRPAARCRHPERGTARCVASLRVASLLALAALLAACAPDPEPPEPTGDTAAAIDTAPTEPTDTGTPTEPPPYAVCADATPAEGLAVDWATEVEPLFDRCVSCHRSNPTGLEFVDPYAELVDVPSAQAPALDRVEPGDLAASYLWHKLCDTHRDVGGSGGQMPVQGGFTEDEAVRIAAWILSGAAP